MNKSKPVLLLLLIVVIVVFGFMLYSKNNTIGTNTVDQSLASGNLPTKQLSGIEILETLDLNRSVPHFKLNVQADGSFQSVPQKLLLIDKVSRKSVMELPLVKSKFEIECAHHNELIVEMHKWETDWFTASSIGAIDTTYNPKLSNKYSVEVVYNDASSETFSSINSISGVCYQVSKAVPTSPDPRDEAQVEE
ncbi:MAG: hypothetical protein M3Q44_03325 [bacterium]|nr:hypothetical protein [bacterium]